MKTTPASLALMLLILGLMPARSVCRADCSPNIVFIFADDQAYDTLGADDDPLVETPHLDRLVRRGTQFTHCYNMGSWTGAVCVASRTMLITGRTLWRARAADTQLRSLRRGKLAESQATMPPLWPERMRSLGYRTYFTGKWHVQAKATDLFDHVKHDIPIGPASARESATSTRVMRGSFSLRFFPSMWRTESNPSVLCHVRNRASVSRIPTHTQLTSVVLPRAFGCLDCTISTGMLWVKTPSGDQ